MTSVLYVEDDNNSRRVMQILLKARMKLPHVTIFEDSSDFITKAEAVEPRPDVVFLDIDVKPYNGFEMLTMLRKSVHFDGTPVVALTASVMNEEVQRLKEAGFDGCIAKPIDVETFPEMLNAIAEGKKIWRIII